MKHNIKVMLIAVASMCESVIALITIGYYCPYRSFCLMTWLEDREFLALEKRENVKSTE